MRERVVHEISKESSGYDLKSGPGGIKEIEFLVQFLQLKHCRKISALITQNTVSAIKRLTACGILDKDTGKLMLHGHRFLRTVDTLLRLNEENVLKIDSEVVDIIIRFLNIKSEDILSAQIQDVRQKILAIATRFYE
jgi:glutamate-ammonia-ligase adenylyltransferase